MKKIFAYGTLTLCGRLFQNRSTNQFSSLYTFLSYCYENDYSLQPPPELDILKYRNFEQVWTLPFSLAATGGILSQYYSWARLSGPVNNRVILLFFSSGYWNVLLPRVYFFISYGWRYGNITCHGLPHSDIAGSKVARHLPDAYRSHATSFIAFLCQGIHHTPLVTYSSRT